MADFETAEPCGGFWAGAARIRTGYLAGVPAELLVLKLAEEVGEVAEAYIGMTGGNPRKGVHKTATDVLDELADVILAAAVPLVPAGRIEPGEDVLAAAIREAREETGVTLHRDDAEFSHVLHRTAASLPGPCHAVSDYWFTFRHWVGEPHAAESDKASEVLWIDPSAPPPDLIPHCAQVLAAIGRGEAFSVHGWTDESGRWDGSALV